MAATIGTRALSTTYIVDVEDSQRNLLMFIPVAINYSYNYIFHVNSVYLRNIKSFQEILTESKNRRKFCFVDNDVHLGNSIFCISKLHELGG